MELYFHKRLYTLLIHYYSQEGSKDRINEAGHVQPHLVYVLECIY